MADSRKSQRPKGPRTGGKGSSSGWSTSRPGGKGGDSRGQDDRRSGAPKGPSKGPAKGPARGPAKGPGANRSGAPRRDDRRQDAGSGRGPEGGRPPRDARREDRRENRREDAPKVKKSTRVDDFDFDIDERFDPEAPAAFPEPARAAKGQAGRPGGERSSRPPRARFEKSERPPREPRAPEADRARPAHPEDEGKSVTAGRNPVRELLEDAPRRVDAVFVRKGQRDAKVQEIVALADERRIKVQFVDDAFLRRLHPGAHQGVIAVTAAVEYAELDALIASVAAAPLPVLLALDKIQDPGNLGAIARTAWALGAAGILVPRHGGAYIGSGAMRASAGALHHLPVARVTNMSQALDACAGAGLAILCADATGENIHSAQVRLPAVLVLGGEEKGVRYGVAKHCEQKLAIPLKRDFDSLNVAQAAAICLARLGLL